MYIYYSGYLREIKGSTVTITVMCYCIHYIPRRSPVLSSFKSRTSIHMPIISRNGEQSVIPTTHISETTNTEALIRARMIIPTIEFIIIKLLTIRSPFRRVLSARSHQPTRSLVGSEGRLQSARFDHLSQYRLVYWYD